MKKEEIFTALEKSRQAFHEAIENLSDEDMLEPGVAGNWSVKDLIIHLTMWEAEMVKLLWQAKQGQKPTTAHFGQADVDQTNERWFKLTQGRAVEVALEEFEGVRNQLFRRLEGFTDKDLTDPKRYSWLKGEPLHEWIAGDSFDHEAEHTAQIRTWREQKGI